MKFIAIIRLDSDLDKALKISSFTCINLYDNIFLLNRELTNYCCDNIVNLVPLLTDLEITIAGYN
jgi:hypothetical protein